MITKYSIGNGRSNLINLALSMHYLSWKHNIEVADHNAQTMSFRKRARVIYQSTLSYFDAS